MSNYDIIVIGGGHNGLTAAASLAKKGKKVILLEKRSILGGIGAGEEFYEGHSTTGLLHDTSGVREKVIKELGLEQFGLSFSVGRAPVSILSKDGKCLHLPSDLDQAKMEIAKFSQNDADAYVEYRLFIEKIRGFMKGLFDEFPPDLVNLGAKQLLELGKKGLALKRLGKKTMLEFLKVAPMSVADFLNERFETDFIKAGIAGPAIYGSYTGPWSSYTTLNLLMWECMANISIDGGPQALVKSLESAASSFGVEVKTDSGVDKILLDENRAVKGVRLTSGEEVLAPAVCSSTTPHVTFYELLLPNQISYALEQGIKYYRSRGTTAKINLAVKGNPLFNGENAASFRTGNSFDEMEKAFDPVKYRKFSDEPVLDIHRTGISPEGSSSLSVLVHFAPHHFDDGWSETTKDKLLSTALQTLDIYSPGLSESVIGSEVLSPVDLESRYGLTYGHIYHGEHAVDQLITRPIPSCSRYETPVKGLFLGGSGSHPGGGITCMPGYLAAKMILKSI